MSGFVGVAAARPGVSLSISDLDDLAKAYEGLRRAGRRRTALAAGHAVFLAFPSAWQTEDAAEDAGPWYHAVGAPIVAGTPRGAQLTDLDGQFALVHHDAETGTVTVATDPYATIGVYTAERDGRVYVSTSLLALASALKAAPDPPALRSFLRAGYQFGKQTGWQGIERLDPGTALELTADGARTVTYWSPQVDHALRSLTLAECVDRMIEIGIDTRRGLADGHGQWADLTGGFDTRMNTLLLDEAEVPFDAYTRSQGVAEDVEIAEAIARSRGWVWRAFSLPSDWAARVQDTVSSALAWGDGQLDAVMLARSLQFDADRAAIHRRVISAVGGELLRNAASQQEFLRAGRTSRVSYDNWIDMRMLHPMSTAVFVTDPTPEVRDDFRRRMKSRAAPYRDEPNTTQLDVIYLYRNTGHVGAFTSSTVGLIETRVPFFSKPLVETVMSIAFRHRRMDGLARHVIERIDPKVARVPTAWGGSAEPRRLQTLPRLAPYYADVGRRAVNKVLEKVAGGRLSRARTAPDATARAERAGVLALLSGADGRVRHDELRSAALYDRHEFESLCERARRDPGFDQDVLLGRIATVELALRTVGSSGVT